MDRWTLLRQIAERERLWLHAEFMREFNCGFPLLKRIPATRTQAVLAVLAAPKSFDAGQVHRWLIDRQYAQTDLFLPELGAAERDLREKLSSWYASPAELLGLGQGHGWMFADAKTKRDVARAFVANAAGRENHGRGINLDYFFNEAAPETILPWKDFRSPSLAEVMKTAVAVWTKYAPKSLGRTDDGDYAVALRATPGWDRGTKWTASVLFEKPAFGGLGFSHRLLIKREPGPQLEFRYDTALCISSADWDLVTPENLADSLQLLERLIDKYFTMFPVWLDAEQSGKQ